MHINRDDKTFQTERRDGGGEGGGGNRIFRLTVSETCATHFTLSRASVTAATDAKSRRAQLRKFSVYLGFRPLQVYILLCTSAPKEQNARVTRPCALVCNVLLVARALSSSSLDVILSASQAFPRQTSVPLSTTPAAIINPESLLRLFPFFFCTSCPQGFQSQMRVSSDSDKL